MSRPASPRPVARHPAVPPLPAARRRAGPGRRFRPCLAPPLAPVPGDALPARRALGLPAPLPAAACPAPFRRAGRGRR